MARLPTPITILTGFLGSGKTTLILNLIPQLPPTYKLALLKNEFGDIAIDSLLASSSSISGVQELLNGCICCNLVGQLGDALDTLRTDVSLDRIIIETSGSAFPATLAMEVNRLAKESGNFVLDGVISVVDVENWEGYEDTSVTAKMQARYTDLVVFNKWEECGESRFDVCLDRLGDLEVQTAWVKSDKGQVDKDVVLGIDKALAMEFEAIGKEESDHSHNKAENHQSEVEVLSVTLDQADGTSMGVDLTKLDDFLRKAPKDEIYRIKAILFANSPPISSDGESATSETVLGKTAWYILNWAFGRWTFTHIPIDPTSGPDQADLTHGYPTPPHSQSEIFDKREPALRMTIILARHESSKWKTRIEKQNLLRLEEGPADKALLHIIRIS